MLVQPLGRRSLAVLGHRSAASMILRRRFATRSVLGAGAGAGAGAARHRRLVQPASFLAKSKILLGGGGAARFFAARPAAKSVFNAHTNKNLVLRSRSGTTTHPALLSSRRLFSSPAGRPSPSAINAAYADMGYERKELSSKHKLWWSAALGAALAGLSGLVLHGNSAYNEEDALAPGEVSAMHPLVRSKLASTFKWVAAGLAGTAVVANLALQSGLAIRVATANPWAMLAFTVVGGMGSMLATMAIDGDKNPTLKAAMYMASMSVFGVTLAPVGLLGGPVVLKAALTTGAVVGSLSLVAASAPSERWLAMAGPLSIGLGLTVGASIGTMFLPGSLILHNLAVYGGLAVFGGMQLYDTGRIIHKAKLSVAHPDEVNFQPIDEAFSVYLNTINIFVRLATIFAGNGSNRRR